jgi:phenylalanyl-tRNA synthetase beta chain
MKFSANWLGEFVGLPSKIEDLAELLTMAGVEIEGIEHRGADFDKVVVAQIKASAQHPNADRLSVCQVDDGSGTERQIVCGAKNYQVGDKVPLALPGATLPNGTKIKESKLRGVDSQGMLCSAIELKLGEDASGLLILSPDARVGAPFSELVPSDTVLDVEITPNRGDLLSHYGLAREVAALTKSSLRANPPEPKAPATKQPHVTISNPDKCPFFSARRIENVKVGPSPGWLRTKLEAAGIRSINNIVDISNFVMLEFGQPTHAFDADKLGGDINVRVAHDGEEFLALDGRTYRLSPDDLVIADQKRAVGIGGVMGGEETGVSDSTRNILLEAAYFTPPAIRRTARALGLPSDASYRFERGVDPEMILKASERATELIAEIAGGKPAAEISIAGSLPKPPDNVSLRYEKCDLLLGVHVDPTEINGILERFGLEKGKASKTESTWTIPSYRRDLQREADLIEEVVRTHGVQGISGTDRSRFTLTSDADRSHDFESELRERLAGRGLSEARTSKLIPRHAAAFGENAVDLRNPLSEDHVALRPSLLPGLLKVLEHNIRGGEHRLSMFEVGRVFLAPDAREVRRLGLLFSGPVDGGVHWRASAKRALDFLDLKGAIEAIASKSLSFRRVEKKDLALAAEILLDGKAIGFAGQLSAERATELDATNSVLVAELDLDPLQYSDSSSAKFSELERFPLVERDVALIVPESVTHEEVVRTIETPREPLLARVELFDLFSGSDAANVGAARKSLAYRLTYRAPNRTLTSDEVTVAHAKIRERLRTQLQAELRE